MREMHHVDIASPVNHISLCTGYGGIDLGLKRAIPGLRTIAFSEIEAFAVANLVAKMEAGLLDPAPVWTDVKTFPWEKFCGLVDILSGGYPCQPFSKAGNRKGEGDSRHLWPWIADGIRLCQPAMCFFENVEGHVTLGLSTVVSDLEEMGYQVSWGIFSAAEVGAPHQRRRVFILAYRFKQGLERFAWTVSDWTKAQWEHSEKNGSVSQSGVWRRVSFAGDCSGEEGEQCSICGEDYADCGCPGPTHDGYEYAEFCGTLFARPEQQWPSRPSELQHKWEPSRVVADSNRDGSNRRVLPNQVFGWSNSESAREQQQPGLQLKVGGCGQSSRSNPIPIEPGSTQDFRQTQPPLGRDADGRAGGLDYAELQQSCDNRTDELRLLGNGVVPQTVEKAFLTLLAELIAKENNYAVD